MRSSRKFSSTATETRPEVTKEEILEKYKNEFSFGIDNLIHFGFYKLGGRCFDFKDVLKKYVIKSNRGIFEGYYPNKTTARKLNGKCFYIIELK